MSSIIDEHDGGESINELDSHENMVVVGKHATVLSDNGNTVDVILLKPDYQAFEKVYIVFAEVKYMCQ